MIRCKFARFGANWHENTSKGVENGLNWLKHFHICQVIMSFIKFQLHQHTDIKRKRREWREKTKRTVFFVINQCPLPLQTCFFFLYAQKWDDHSCLYILFSSETIYIRFDQSFVFYLHANKVLSPHSDSADSLNLDTPVSGRMMYGCPNYGPLQTVVLSYNIPIVPKE